MYGQTEPIQLPDSRQFIIAVKKLADSFSYGTDRSPFRGSGIEYVQSRQYQPGDPVRRSTGEFWPQQANHGFANSKPPNDSPVICCLTRPRP
ncbi:MAG UNVERIFIED_CONTAM: hypothetical protein LVR18_41095 [Planctomycetaceae bacterium]|jgi:hypothetical protein